MWPTFILDIANNHGGDLFKACQIVDDIGEVFVAHGVSKLAAFKLQYRDLENYQHGDEAYREKFQKAWLSWSDYARIVRHIEEKGFWTACTAFDPSAASWMGVSGFNFAKVASCSARDWRTIDAIAEHMLPTIFSTAGLTIDDVDNLVSYAEHKGLPFALMHCVAIYPSPNDTLNLRRIAEFKERYPGVTIGWSTHEHPADTRAIQMAYALGARIFECHVASHAVNPYSKRPNEIDRWLAAWEAAVDACEYHGDNSGKEHEALERVARRKIERRAFVNPLKQYIHKTKASLNIAKIALPTDAVIEFSHHYGEGRFDTNGAVLITCVNHDYCKKLIVMQSPQTHPEHYHKVKQESFQVLHGRLWIKIEGRSRVMVPGEIVTVLPGQWHGFMALDDHTVVEEISTTAVPGDSVYRDPRITQNENRKTVVKGWGRFEL